MLPLSYALRNLWRRRTRTLLTVVGIACISTLVILMGGFALGLSGSAAAAASDDVLMVVGANGEHDLVRSVISRGDAEAVAAGLPRVKTVNGERAISVELHMATRKGDTIGLLRGVTSAAFLVHDRVTLVEGHEPREPFELLVGRLAESRMGLAKGTLALGRSIEFGGQTWQVVGLFAAPGTVLEAEMWGRLDDVVHAVNRQDVSCVAAKLEQPKDMKRALLWINRNATAYEVSAVSQRDLYQTLEQALDPITKLAWVMAILVLVGGVFACANTMFAAVLARIREMGALRALGFGPLAVAFSLVVEGVLLGVIGGLAGFWIAGLFGEVPLKFPMGAFYLDLTPGVRLGGLAAALLAGLLGSVVPAWRAIRMPLPDALGGKL